MSENMLMELIKFLIDYGCVLVAYLAIVKAFNIIFNSELRIIGYSSDFNENTKKILTDVEIEKAFGER